MAKTLSIDGPIRPGPGIGRFGWAFRGFITTHDEDHHKNDTHKKPKT